MELITDDGKEETEASSFSSFTVQGETSIFQETYQSN